MSRCYPYLYWDCCLVLHQAALVPLDELPPQAELVARDSAEEVEAQEGYHD